MEEENIIPIKRKRGRPKKPDGLYELPEPKLAKIPNPKKGFQKGISGNPDGRPLGSPNKYSKQIKDRLKKITARLALTLEKELFKEDVMLEDRLKAFQILSKFVLTEKKKIEKKVIRTNRIKVIFSDDYDLLRDTEDFDTEEIDYEEAD